LWFAAKKYYIGATAANNLAITTYTAGAGSGGSDATKARFALRSLYGGNFSREVVNTAAAGFPYA
jgi:hypothetical protein